ncbi:hypothetical protein [Novosphingobium sp. CECT 9465]|uniref:hypothetical protein n=1 Tax=Novosphingobium sp. CECT 9465 TaxID=2829794 RepID=UPI001E534AC1|nr:hypothetical protein [Novosphingobium sp. CECT 9465]CAH0496438.1 hypothetical protein NVSP9465_01472 [Novosphingobium sp. CECT 9465]
MATRTPTTGAMKRKLNRAFQNHLGINTRTARQLLASATLQDKAYELAALIELMAKLKAFRPGLSFTLEAGTSLVFRAKGGPINRGQWPYIRIRDGDRTVGELWVDIEFVAISAPPSAKHATGHLFGQCHELDIVLVIPGTDGRPLPQELLLGIEAKHRPFNKALLKELLGVRREMTMRAFPECRLPQDWWFIWWANELPAQPPSGLVAFCSSSTISKYAAPADFWGIEMEHVPF